MTELVVRGQRVEQDVQIVAGRLVKAGRGDLAVHLVLQLGEQRHFLVEDFDLQVDELFQVLRHLVRFFIHQLLQLIFPGVPHLLIDSAQFLLHFQQKIEGGSQNLTHGHPFLQDCVLIQIADANLFCPFDFAFVGLQAAGDEIHEGGFPFAVGAYQTDVFALEKAE